MATIWGRPKVELKVALELNEEEAKALEVVMSYNVDQFLEMFYTKMGKTVLEPYEKGLRSLFEARGSLALWINRAERAKKEFNVTEGK